MHGEAGGPGDLAGQRPGEEPRPDFFPRGAGGAAAGGAFAGGSLPPPSFPSRSIPLAASLGLGGGIEDMGYLLDLLGPGAGREEVALAARLLGCNEDLDLFPAVVVERILLESDPARLGAAALLLDLGLKILCFSPYKNDSGVPVARVAIEAVLDAYKGLYERLGGVLGPITGTIASSGFLTAGDIEGLLRLALDIPGVEKMVRMAARELTDQDPSWAERTLFDGEVDLAAGLPPGAVEILRDAALEELAPLDALDYLSGRDTGQFGGLDPTCPLERMGTLRRIAGRSGEDELLRWLRAHAGSGTSRLLVSALSPRAHAGVLERLIRSEAIGSRLRGGAVVKLAGARADEEMASMVLALLDGSWPGRRDLFVQAAENLLSGGRPADPWFTRIVLRLESLLERCRDELPPAVKGDLERVLSQYRARSG